MASSDQIRDFWLWFEANIDCIAWAYDQSDIDWLRDNLSPQVRRLGDRLNWEIGPYRDPARTFVLSPTVRENLPLTRSVVAAAPAIRDWRFLHAKPAKVLNTLEFSAHGCSINADNWRYQLTAYNAGEFVDIDLYLDAPISNETMFAELVVEALTGEERRLDQVGCITCRIVDPDDLPANLTQIKHLNDHLDQVLATPDREP